MLGSGTRKPSPKKSKAKDPPVLVAEKFRAAMQSESAESAMYATLDLSAMLSSPMQIVYSRNRIRKWVAFDRRVITSCGAHLEYDPETSIVVDSESGRSVLSRYRIGALEFVDAFSLNNVLMVRSVVRSVRRVAARSEREKKLTDTLLLTWTGPHFVGFCTATTTIGARIDNRMVALPVLDFSFCQLKDVAEMLEKPPRDGKEIRDKNVYLHYLAHADAVARAEEEKKKQQEEEEERAKSSVLGGGPSRRDDVIIKAKNRVGDEGHIVIDKNQLMRGSKSNASLDSRIELLEDAESGIRDDKSRYACSGLKLNNNALEDAGKLETVCRLVVMNAFYFLSWVDLASNALTHVPDLSSFPIVSLYLHDNKITSVNDVQNLKGMKLLQNLTLFGNPIQSDIPAKYKLPVLSLLLVPDEAAVQRQHEEMERKKKEAGTLRKAMDSIRRETAKSPGLLAQTRAGSSRPQSRAAAAASPGGGGGDDDEEGGGGLHEIISPTRQRYFPVLPHVPPPPPPPPILKLKTLDHTVITGEDKKALTAWIAMYIKTPVKKKRGH